MNSNNEYVLDINSSDETDNTDCKVGPNQKTTSQSRANRHITFALPAHNQEESHKDDGSTYCSARSRLNLRSFLLGVPSR